MGNWELLVPGVGCVAPKEVDGAPILVFPKREPGAPVPIPPVVVPKLGTVPKPEFPKVVEVPNGLGLAFAADVPPNNEV